MKVAGDDVKVFAPLPAEVLAVGATTTADPPVMWESWTPEPSASAKT